MQLFRALMKIIGLYITNIKYSYIYFNYMIIRIDKGSYTAKVLIY